MQQETLDQQQAVGMQFESNAAFPTDTTVRQQPQPFPPLETSRCERIMAQIVLEDGVTIQTVPNVLVHVLRQQRQQQNNGDDDESSTSSSSSSDVDAMEEDNDGDADVNQDTTSGATTSSTQAFWMHRQIREAIYGNVWLARVLQRSTNNRWQVTPQQCAIKELNWQQIRRERHRLAEDPLQELAAMQYLRKTLLHPSEDVVSGMERTHIVMPVAAWSDERHLYSIMPFAAGGELFDMLDARGGGDENGGGCSEPEARYWMQQVCSALATLHATGVCHRDVSLENVLVTATGSVVLIDLGMCLQHDRRYLVGPQGTCGKWTYMSPEIVRDEAFHGDTVDVWATGVILFLLLTGFPPWHRASPADEHYRYMSAGEWKAFFLDLLC